LIPIIIIFQFCRKQGGMETQEVKTGQGRKWRQLNAVNKEVNTRSILHPGRILGDWSPPSLLNFVWSIHNLLTSYSTVVLYIRDPGGLGFSAQQYPPKNELHISVWQYWPSQKCLQINHKQYQQVVMNFFKIPIL